METHEKYLNEDSIYIKNAQLIRELGLVTLSRLKCCGNCKYYLHDAEDFFCLEPQNGDIYYKIFQEYSLSIDPTKICDRFKLRR
jgi:hypothetical protein